MTAYIEKNFYFYDTRLERGVALPCPEWHCHARMVGKAHKSRRASTEQGAEHISTVTCLQYV